MSVGMALAAVAVSAVIVFALRAFPFAVFGKNRHMPRALVQLGQALPSAVMAVLVVYCLKDAGTDWLGVGLPKLIAVAVVAVCYKLTHKTLLTICIGTAAYMLLIRLL